MIARTAALAVLLTLGMASTPADAQRRQRVIEVFGADECKPSSGDEIVVCSRRPESDRFRIPTELREAAQADAVAKDTKVDEAVALGRTGTDSCSAIGPGGHTGCFMQQVNNDRLEKRQVRRARQEEPQ